MLTALLHGKGRRLAEHASAEESLRTAYGRYEDLLTATVFERLAYLEGGTLWDILRRTFGVAAWPNAEPAVLRQVQFWPMWRAAFDLLGKSVEPDVVIQLVIGEDRAPWTFIIECKLWGSQDLTQLGDEWIAYQHEAADEFDPDRTTLLALGGLWSDRRLVPALDDYARGRFGHSICAGAADWSQLMNAVASTPTVGHELRILADIRQALELHGHRISQPLQGLPDVGNRLGLDGSAMSRSQKAFHHAA